MIVFHYHIVEIYYSMHGTVKKLLYPTYNRRDGCDRRDGGRNSTGGNESDNYSHHNKKNELSEMGLQKVCGIYNRLFLKNFLTASQCETKISSELRHKLYNYFNGDFANCALFHNKTNISQDNHQFDNAFSLISNFANNFNNNNNNLNNKLANLTSVRSTHKLSSNDSNDNRQQQIKHKWNQYQQQAVVRVTITVQQIHNQPITKIHKIRKPRKQ